MVGAILIICVSNLRNRKDGEENKSLPQLWLSLPDNMDPDRYFSGYDLKNAGRKQKFGYAKIMFNLDGDVFTLSPVAYINS